LQGLLHDFVSFRDPSLHTTNGTWDLIAEIRAGSLTDLDRVLREVRTIDGVLNSETSILLSSV